MIAKRGIVYSILCVLLLGSFLSTSQPADAASGSITIAPGETKYLSFGTCADGDVLLWSLEISTLSTIFEYWLQAPDGTHLSTYSLTWGTIVGMAGEWKLGFHIDESGFWSATVYYTIYRTTPYLEILGPSSDSSYTNLAEFMAWGNVDDFADEVAVSLDGVHYDSADLYSGVWNAPISLSLDGTYLMVAEATVNWGSYSVKYYDTVSFTLDRVLPELRITHPSDNSYVGGQVDLEWECEDNSGVQLMMEARVDLQGWTQVDECHYSCSLTEGGHILQVRVVDPASNLVNATVSVISDSTSPVVTLTSPTTDSKVSTDSVIVTWTGTDALSGIDHYEVKISGGEWINVGTDFAYAFTGLEDKWYTVTVKAVDKSGNTEESSVSFGVYTSIWSTNGPYDGIPLYLLAAAIIVSALAAYSVIRRRGRRGEPPLPEEPDSNAP